MNRSSLFWAWGAVAAVVSITACQAIANLQTRVSDPIATGCFSSDSNTTAGGLPPVVAGSGAIRLANLVPSAAGVGADFCIRTSGTAWGRPFFRDNGSTGLCRAGLQYKQVTVPFGVGAKAIDVKVIPAGLTCDATATSELDGIQVGDSAKAPVQSVLRIGGDGSPEKLVALPEEPPGTNTTGSDIRIVNAIVGAPQILFGGAATNTLPTTVSVSFSPSPIPFGGVEPAGQSPVEGTFDAEGYFQGFSEPLNYVLSLDGTNAIIIYPTSRSSPTLSLYAIGNVNDPLYTPSGLVCNDKASVLQDNGAYDAGGVDAGASDAGLVLDRALLADCSETQLASLDLVSFNVALFGADADDYEERGPYIYGASSVIASSTADVMCVYETCDESVRDAINSLLGSSSGSLKYAYYLTSQQVSTATPPTQFAQWPGAPPADPVNLATPPCTTDQATPVFQCLEQECEDGGSPSGTLEGNTDCLEKCPGQIGAILPDTTCFDCVGDNVSSLQSFATSQANCTQQALRPLAFGGQNPSMLLSKYPFTKKSDGTNNTAAFIFGSTNYRRAALYGQIQIDSAHTLDVYCPQLTSPLIYRNLAYNGIYANPNSTNGEDGGVPASEAAYIDEQNLQAQQLVAWIKQMSGSNPAVILGDWHASENGSVNGTQVTVAVGVSTLNYLDSNLTRAQAADWTPQCNYCNGVWGESLTGGVPGYDFLTDYLYNYTAADPVISENMLYTAPVVNGISVATTPGEAPIPLTGPVSEYYAKEVRVKRPQ